MSVSLPTWQISLEERPRIAHCALGRHNLAGQNRTEQYFLPDLWCLHLYRYHAHIKISGFNQVIRPGSLTIFPPATPLVYAYREVSHHLYVHFRLGNGVTSPFQIAMHCETGADNELWNRDLTFLIEAFRTHPLRAEVKLWELLFELCENHQNESTHHPSLEKALRLIELRLSEPLSAAALAREVGLSHNHLIRLFQKETGRSISAYIRARRAWRARHLLENTTLPFVSVAAQIGVEPGKALCDLVKAETGFSPRQLRTQRLNSPKNWSEEAANAA